MGRKDSGRGKSLYNSNERETPVHAGGTQKLLIAALADFFCLEDLFSSENSAEGPYTKGSI